MPFVSPRGLPRMPEDALATRLRALVAATDRSARVDRDPVRYPRRYTSPADREVAAILAASLAFGRVTAFFRALDVLFARADARGGPAAWAMSLSRGSDSDLFDSFVYRWNRGADVFALLAAIGEVLREHGRIEAIFAGDGGARAALDRGIPVLRDGARRALGLPPNAGLPRGLGTLLPRPAEGSACKRWNLALRWLVRPEDGVDLGVWSTLSPADLVIPLDTHVHRIARLVGLTARNDGSFRTAKEITRALAAYFPEDPVGVDFALAHLGISGACQAARDPACDACALKPLCTVWTG